MKNHHTVTCKTVWSQQVKVFIKNMVKKKEKRYSQDNTNIISSQWSPIASPLLALSFSSSKLSL